ncbi:MAG: DUF5915 domain-containing protein, partial [Nocardioidaceae bacterium]
LTRDVTTALEAFDTQRVGQLLSEFVDHLSNWYVRRSRRRFWDGDLAALWTLHETLELITRLLAPVTPFVTERVWQDVVRSVDDDASESVHLARWPSHDESLVDPDLEASMALVRRLVELGRAARAEAKVKTRQPLRRALVASAAFAGLTPELRAEVASELNVETVESFASAGDLVDHATKGNFRTLGKRFGTRTPAVAAAIAAADPEKLAKELAATGAATLDVDGPVQVSADEVIVSERPRAGWSVVNDQGETVALDVELTPELVRAGLAREVVRLIQDARRAAGLDVTDRIVVRWWSDGAVAEALREHADLVSREVLALGMTEEAAEPPDGRWRRNDELQLAFDITKAATEP